MNCIMANVDIIKQRIRKVVEEKRKILEKTRYREKQSESIHRLKVHLGLETKEDQAKQLTPEERRIERIKKRFRTIKNMQKQQREAPMLFACLMPSCGAVVDE